MTTTIAPSEKEITWIDARGPRFSATITTVLLAIAFVLHAPAVIAFQWVVFGIAAFYSPPKSPYAFLYKEFVQPRLHGPVPSEDLRPVRFAQLVGFIFASVALIGAISGVGALFTGAVALCLVAAFLNAAFNFCLGCQTYLLLVRLRHRAG